MDKPKLKKGCCLEVMATIPDNYFDMVCCDPPYGTTACKWDSVIDLELMWEQLRRIVKPSGVMAFTAQNPFTSSLIMSNPKWFRQSIVWAKNKASGHLNANRRHLTKHEDIVIFSSKQGTYNKQKTVGHKPANYAKRGKQSECYGDSDSTEYEGGNTDRCPTTIIEISVMNNDGSHGVKYHPNQKPVELMEYLIKTYSNEEERVLDFAMGSGTTGVACMNLNRRFVGIEKDLDKDGNPLGYFDIAKNRIKEAYDCR